MFSKREFPSAAAALCAAIITVVVALPAKAQVLEEVTYMLPAPAFLPSFAPWMLAQARGYYASEGLKVNFQSGRGGVDVAQLLRYFVPFDNF
mgnify:CR=1 FL=1